MSSTIGIGLISAIFGKVWPLHVCWHVKKRLFNLVPSLPRVTGQRVTINVNRCCNQKQWAAWLQALGQGAAHSSWLISLKPCMFPLTPQQGGLILHTVQNNPPAYSLLTLYLYVQYDSWGPYPNTDTDVNENFSRGGSCPDLGLSIQKIQVEIQLS